jgi:hypothetical protein
VLIARQQSKPAKQKGELGAEKAVNFIINLIFRTFEGLPPELRGRLLASTVAPGLLTWSTFSGWLARIFLSHLFWILLI